MVSYANTRTDSNIFFSNLSCINLFAFHRHTWLPFNIQNNVNLWLDLERNYQSLLDKFLDWVCDAIPTKLNLVILWRFSCLVYRPRMLPIIIWEIWECIYQIYYLQISLFCSWHEKMQYWNMDLPTLCFTSQVNFHLQSWHEVVMQNS